MDFDRTAYTHYIEESQMSNSILNLRQESVVLFSHILKLFKVKT